MRLPHIRRSILGGLICAGLLGCLDGGPATAGVRELLFSRRAHVPKSHMELGNWRLTIAANIFSGEKTCHLENRKDRIIYAGGALGFRFENTSIRWAPG